MRSVQDMVYSVCRRTKGDKMNRIAKYLRSEGNKQAGKAPSVVPENYTNRCNFCGSSVEGAHFAAFSMIGLPKAIICKSCIQALAIKARFTDPDVFGLAFSDKPDYRALEAKVSRRLAGEVGSPKSKQLAATLSILVVKRVSAILSGCVFEQDPKTGVPTTIPQIAFVTKEQDAFLALMQIAFKEVGVVCRIATKAEIESGEAYRKLIEEQTNGEETWAEHAILLCKGHATLKEKNKIGIIYAVQSAQEIPADAAVWGKD